MYATAVSRTPGSPAGHRLACANRPRCPVATPAARAASVASITGMAGVISFPSESVLASHAAGRVDLAGLRAGIGQVGPPPGGGDHTRRDQRQAVEEAGDLLRAAQVIRAGRVLVVSGDRLIE